MRKASTALLEQGTQAPSPAPDLIPAANEQGLTGNSQSDWYSKRGQFMETAFSVAAGLVLSTVSTPWPGC